MAVGVPDVGVDLALDVFEFVEVGDAFLAIVDDDVADFGEGFGVAKAECGGAVAGDEFGGSVGHAPAFAGVGEGLELAEGEAVVDEAEVGLPGPLVDIRAPSRLCPRRSIFPRGRPAGWGRAGGGLDGQEGGGGRCGLCLHRRGR